MIDMNLLANSESLWDGAILAIVGISVVFSALALIWGATFLVGRVLSGNRNKTTAPGTVSNNQQASTQASDQIDGRTLAVISAAVMAVAGPSVKITRIRQFHRMPGSAWASHGRVAVQSVHKMRKK